MSLRCFLFSEASLRQNFLPVVEDITLVGGKALDVKGIIVELYGSLPMHITKFIF